MAHDPQFIEPWVLAEQRETLNGDLAVDVMGRLHDQLASDQGRVVYQLYFDKDPRGIACILGSFGASLQLYCQRCLKPIAIDIKHDISVGLVVTREEAELLPDEYEPLQLTGNQLSLLHFIEDEILLALPMAPLHEPDQCPSRTMVEKLRPVRETPFAKLRDLLIPDPNDRSKENQ